MQLSNEYHHRHWHYIYSLRKKRSNSEPQQIIAGQIFTVIVSIGAGLALDNYKVPIAALAGALLVMPGIVDLSASIAGALGAKVNHRLELGQKTISVIINSLAFALFLVVTTGAIVGSFGALIGSIFFDVSWLNIVLLSVISTTVVGVVVFPIVALLVVFLRRMQLNPDNLVGPIQSSIVDVVAVLAIAVCASQLL